MLQIDTKTRDEIVRILRDILAPANSGYTIIQIANILANLKDVEVIKKPETTGTPHE